MTQAYAGAREFFRRQHTDSAVMIVWASVCLSALRISLEISSSLVLWHVYGRSIVARDHLSIVRIKPQLVVSNGDLLKGLGFVHYLIVLSLWIPLSIGILILVFKYITPMWWRQHSQRASKVSPGAIGIIATLVMFVCIPGLLGFAPAMAFGTGAAVLGLYWIRRSRPEDTSPP